MKENDEIASLIVKYREETCTPAEKERLFELMRHHNIRRQLIEDMEKAFAEKKYTSSMMAHESSERIMHALLAHIGSDEMNDEMPAITPKKKYKALWIAAAVLLSVASIFYLLHPTLTAELSIQVSQKEIKKVVLPDSSVAWINSASSIRYPPTFGKDNRKVYLDEGEAYFDVRENAKLPFEVYSGSIRITVLGTAFRVKSYKSLSEIKVSVVKGKVSVSEGQKEIALLSKNQEVVYHKTNKSHEVRNVKETIEQTVGWKEGKIVLETTSFDDIMLTIANRYAIKPVYDHGLFSKCESSIVIDSNSTLEQTMEQLALIQNIEFKIIGTEVHITGTGCN